MTVDFDRLKETEMPELEDQMRERANQAVNLITQVVDEHRSMIEGLEALQGQLSRTQQALSLEQGAHEATKQRALGIEAERDAKALALAEAEQRIAELEDKLAQLEAALTELKPKAAKKK